MPDDPVAVSLEGLKRSVRKVEKAIEEERAKTMAEKLNNPGHGAVDFGQPILTLGQLKDKITSTMYNTVNDWIDDADASVPQHVLPRLFLECHNVVEARYNVVTSILFPKSGGGRVDKKTMRDHMLNNHEELFLLAPSKQEERARDLRRILDNVGVYLHDNSVSPDYVRRLLEDSGLRAVVAKYYEIIVHVFLQQPRATFSNDCGEIQPFKTVLHSRPVDGESISEGQPCLVAFPSMMVGGEMWSSKFTLGDTEPGAPATGGPVVHDPSTNQAGLRDSSAGAGAQTHTQGLVGANPVVSGGPLDHTGATRGPRPPQRSVSAKEGQLAAAQDPSHSNDDRQRSSNANRRDSSTSWPHERR